MMKLEKMQTLSATLVLETGLHIGGGDSAMHIGGIDSPVIKHPHNKQPYIPGSSIKGKMRSMLEWRAGVIRETEGQVLSYTKWSKLNGEAKTRGLAILQLFGLGGSDKLSNEQALEIGPTRLSFWDCNLEPEWLGKYDGQCPMEDKTENRIDRIRGVAEHPRHIERVPAGARFQFRLTIRTLTGDQNILLPELLCGLKLLEMDGLGGSLSRGYGKIRFEQLKLDEQDLTGDFQVIKPL